MPSTAPSRPTMRRPPVSGQKSPAGVGVVRDQEAAQDPGRRRVASRVRRERRGGRRRGAVPGLGRGRVARLRRGAYAPWGAGVAAEALAGVRAERRRRGRVPLRLPGRWRTAAPRRTPLRLGGSVPAGPGPGGAPYRGARRRVALRGPAAVRRLVRELHLVERDGVPLNAVARSRRRSRDPSGSGRSTRPRSRPAAGPPAAWRLGEADAGRTARRRRGGVLRGGLGRRRVRRAGARQGRAADVAELVRRFCHGAASRARAHGVALVPSAGRSPRAGARRARGIITKSRGEVRACSDRGRVAARRLLLPVSLAAAATMAARRTSRTGTPCAAAAATHASNSGFTWGGPKGPVATLTGMRP